MDIGTDCSWWRHQMETFSALLALCAGNSPVISEFPPPPPPKGQWHRVLMFPLICVWTNGWVNNRHAGYLRRHHAHYDVTVTCHLICCRYQFDGIHAVSYETCTLKSRPEELDNIRSFRIKVCAGACWTYLLPPQLPVGTSLAFEWAVKVAITAIGFSWVLRSMSFWKERSNLLITILPNVLPC